MLVTAPLIGEWNIVMSVSVCVSVHIAQQMPLPLNISCSSKSRLVLPFWYLLTRVVPDRFQQSSKTVVCVCVSVHKHIYLYIIVHTYLQVIGLTKVFLFKFLLQLINI